MNKATTLEQEPRKQNSAIYRNQSKLYGLGTCFSDNTNLKSLRSKLSLSYETCEFVHITNYNFLLHSISSPIALGEEIESLKQNGRWILTDGF